MFLKKISYREFCVKYVSVSFLLFSMAFSHFVFADGNDIRITEKNGILKIENDVFSRQFRYQNDSDIPKFYSFSWKDKTTGKELLRNQTGQWFEFCIENKVLLSENGGWNYDGYTKRNLENGGVEIVINLIDGEKSPAPARNIQLKYYLQVFPNSTITRERIQLLPQNDKPLRLTKNLKKVHLIFPKYTFNQFGNSELQIQQIQLASWQGEVLNDVDWNIRPNYRLMLKQGKSGRNLSQNHMYHPTIINSVISKENSTVKFKGPIGIAVNDKENIGFIIAYEHGSPDNDESQNYLAIKFGLVDESLLSMQVKALKGAYFDNELIHKNNPYSTVWVNVGYFNGSTFDDGQAAFWDFLYRYQSEHLAPRKPTIYYNTWGMQRDDQKEKKKRPQDILTEKRILKEIDYAHQLGVDVFVIDDGWQNYFGDWQPVSDRLPNGFTKIKAKLDSLGMRMGLWMAAEGIAPESNLYKEHPEWLVRNEDGTETIGRWKKPIGCFSSGYKKYFTDLCKYWIDQGFSYFKWDGLDKHLCYSPDHNHGDKTINAEERAYRSGYDFILAVTDVARELSEYHPDLVIVYDMTEELRNLGLAFLSEARFFWINNGATWYDDLSFYRTKSIRTVTNLYNQIIPTILQTSANYPHQSEWYGAQQYNTNTTLLGGGGFWGDLSEMKEEERKKVGEKINIYKRVANTVVATRPIVSGKIGSSPEIYEYIDANKSEGQIIAFSGSALKSKYQTQKINKSKFFCMLHNAYDLNEDGSLTLPFVYPQPDATCDAFVLSGENTPGRIVSSSCWLKDAEVINSNSISFVNGAVGKQEILWQVDTGKPTIHSDGEKAVKYIIERRGQNYLIKLSESLPNISIIIAAKSE